VLVVQAAVTGGNARKRANRDVGWRWHGYCGISQKRDGGSGIG
jgi:hypothetical protein